MGRKRLSSPAAKDTRSELPAEPSVVRGLESFQRARSFLGAEITLILFLLDLSGSMRGDPIECLRKGIRLFLDAVAEHPRASKAVEVALIAVCGEKPRLLSPFQPAPDVVEPKLEAGGATPLNAACLMALDVVTAKRADNIRKGIDSRTPLVLVISDGEATDPELKDQAKAAIAAAEGAKPTLVEVHGLAVNVKAVGELEAVLSRPPVLVTKYGFDEIFRRLSQSVIARGTGGTADILRPLQEPLPPSAVEDQAEAAENSEE